MKINNKSVLDEFYIVRDGLPEAVIIIDGSASEKVICAANDLRDNIRSISGCVLSIIRSTDQQAGGPGRKILVGYSDEVKSAGFHGCTGYPGTEITILWRKAETLILYGNDDGLYEGTRYAVTLLLESFGCGWFGPDELWTVIPDKKTLSVGFLQKQIEPRFTSRRNWVLNKNPELGSRWFLGGQEKEIEHAYWRLFPRE
ncbi:MAG: hypothetical protein ACYC5K_06965, partial [Saccharofermentanales bacterium]